jgi:hypothetical protein
LCTFTVTDTESGELELPASSVTTRANSSFVSDATLGATKVGEELTTIGLSINGKRLYLRLNSVTKIPSLIESVS